MAQGAIAAKKNKVILQCGAGSSRIDDELGDKTAFTVVGPPRDYPVLSLDYLATKNPRPKTVGLVIMDDPAYHEMVAGIKERCAKHGMTVVFEEVLPLNVQDLRPTVTKMRRAGELDIVINTG